MKPVDREFLFAWLFTMGLGAVVGIGELALTGRDFSLISIPVLSTIVIGILYLAVGRGGEGK